MRRARSFVCWATHGDPTPSSDARPARLARAELGEISLYTLFVAACQNTSKTPTRAEWRQRQGSTNAKPNEPGNSPAAHRRPGVGSGRAQVGGELVYSALQTGRTGRPFPPLSYAHPRPSVSTMRRRASFSSWAGWHPFSWALRTAFCTGLQLLPDRESPLQELRGWKLFCLAQRMLLFAPPGTPVFRPLSSTAVTCVQMRLGPTCFSKQLMRAWRHFAGGGRSALSSEPHE